MTQLRRFSAITLLSIALLSWLVPVMAEGPDAGVPTAEVIEIPNARVPSPGILTGGQPTVRQFEEAVAAGYKTIVNLRTLNEFGVWDEAAKARELGVKYVSIPVAGRAGMTEENAAALTEVLGERSNYPVLVHCASGNRVGGLFALNAAFNEGKGTDEALAAGRAAGLTSLAPMVRAILEGDSD